MEDQSEHEVYGGEIPADDGEDVDMASRADDDQDYTDDPNSKVGPSQSNLIQSRFAKSRFCGGSCVDSASFLVFVNSGAGGHEEAAEGDRGRGRRAPRYAGQGGKGDGSCSRYCDFLLV